MTKRSNAMLPALAVAISVACLVHLWAPPSWSYYPLERTWSRAPLPGAVGMAWYGRSLTSLAAGAAAGLLAWLVQRLLSGRQGQPQAEAAPGLPGIALAWGACLIFAGSYLCIAYEQYVHWILHGGVRP